MRGHGTWQDWDFSHLIQALKQWRAINPSDKESVNDREKWKRESLFNASVQKRSCVYCNDVNHNTRECHAWSAWMKGKGF